VRHNGNPDSNATLGYGQARGGNAQAQRRQGKRRKYERVGATHQKLRVGDGAHERPDNRPERPHHRQSGGSDGRA
jgi:hypothetical protein